VNKAMAVTSIAYKMENYYYLGIKYDV